MTKKNLDDLVDAKDPEMPTVAAGETVPVTERPAAIDDTATAPAAWYYCRHRATELHVLASSSAEAEAKCKRALNIIRTQHAIHVSAHDGYKPSGIDLDLEKQLNAAG